MNRFRLTISQVIAIFSITFLFAPFIALIGASFDGATQFHLQFPPESFSLRWYTELSSKYLHPLLNSTIVAFCVAVVSGIFGIVAAVGLIRSETRYADILLAYFRIPLQIPMIVTGAVFLQFYYLLGAFSGYNPTRNLTGLIIAHCFVAIPYAIASTYAVLTRIGPSIDQAAQSLGASDWQILWNVILPAAKPGIAAGIFYSFIVSFGDVPVALYLVSGDLQTFPVQVFYDMQFDLNPEILSSSVLVIVASLIAVLAVQKLVGLDMILPGRRK